MLRRTRRHGSRASRWLASPAGLLALTLCLAFYLVPGLRARARCLLLACDGPTGLEHVRVEYVIDGDTLVVSGDRTIRLLGVDAPETSNPNMAGPQPLGAEAAARLAELVEGRQVGLERDISEADHYGRLLRHVWFGSTLVSEVLVSEGLAYAGSVPPDEAYADRLRVAEDEARRAARGIWGRPRPTPLPIFRDGK